jgi:hypothetical protein
MTISVRSARDGRAARGAVIPAGRSGPARQSRAANRQQRVITLAIVLTAVTRHLRDRRFQADVITLAIGIAALAGLAREGQARSLSRLATWYQQENLRDPRTAKARQA